MKLRFDIFVHLCKIIHENLFIASCYWTLGELFTRVEGEFFCPTKFCDL